jgi:hypothetical protein
MPRDSSTRPATRPHSQEAYRPDGGGGGAGLPPAGEGSLEAEVLLRMLSHASGVNAIFAACMKR